MTRRVCICTSSAVISFTIRKTLARSRHLGWALELRDVEAALAASDEATTLLIIDADLLRQGPAAPKLWREVMTRGKPTVVLDLRDLGIPLEAPDEARVVTVRGRTRGELDLDVVEAELIAAVGRAIRASTRSPSSAIALPPPCAEHSTDLIELIVLGVSTGGPIVLPELLRDLNQPAVPMLIVQHMPAGQTASFAKQLSEECRLEVCEVAGGSLPLSRTIGLLEGGHDFRIERKGNAPCLRKTFLPGNPFHPNIDEILISAVASGFVVGAAILSGMGRDGAAGALAMAQQGLPVVAQLPHTCAVAGMPQATIDNGAARWVQSPRGIADTLNRWSDTARRAAHRPGASSSR